MATTLYLTQTTCTDAVDASMQGDLAESQNLFTQIIEKVPGQDFGKWMTGPFTSAAIIGGSFQAILAGNGNQFGRAGFWVRLYRRSVAGTETLISDAQMGPTTWFTSSLATFTIALPISTMQMAIGERLILRATLIHVTTPLQTGLSGFLHYDNSPAQVSRLTYPETLPILNACSPWTQPDATPQPDEGEGEEIDPGTHDDDPEIYAVLGTTGAIGIAPETWEEHMPSRFNTTRDRVLDSNGDPVPGAKIWAYAAGTSTPKATYTDAARTTIGDNPMVCDAGGRIPERWLAAGTYKFVYTDSNDVLLHTDDEVPGDLVSNSGTGLTRNLLLNGDFRVSQRALGATSDDAYCFDRWYVLTQTGSVAMSQLSHPEDAQATAARMTQSQASAQRMGLAQIVEGNNCAHLRSQDVVLSGRIRCSVSQAIRYAILSWTGTKDTVTSDVVNDWTSSSYTAGGFFLGSNLVVTAVGSLTPAANTWTALPDLTEAASASLNNLIVMIWTEGTIAQNATLDFGVIQLQSGDESTAFERVQEAQSVAECMRYYEAGTVYFQGYANGTEVHAKEVRYHVRKRTTPTIGITSSTSTNCVQTSANATADVFRHVCTAAGAGVFTGDAGWTANAEL